jgi:hypothetical protein
MLRNCCGFGGDPRYFLLLADLDEGRILARTGEALEQNLGGTIALVPPTLKTREELS